MEYPTKTPFYKTKLFLGCIIGLLVIVVMALIYYFAIYKKKPTTTTVSSASTNGASSASTNGASSASTNGASSASTNGASSASTNGASSASTNGASSASTNGATTISNASGDNGITTTGVPIIAALQKLDPVFAKKTLLTKLNTAKTAATNWLDNVGEIQYRTVISPTKQATVLLAGTNGHEPSWLVNSVPNLVAISSFGHYLPTLAHILSYVMAGCTEANFWGPTGTNCTGKGFVTNAHAAYKIIGQINAEAINYASKYLGANYVNGNFVIKTCTIGISCGYIPDLNNLIKSGTLHPPNVWLVCDEAKDVVTKSKKLISLLTSLVTNTAWIKQLPPTGIVITGSYPVIPLSCLYCPGMGVGIPAWHAVFETFMTGYIKQLNALVGDVKTTARDLGVISGYYNQTA